MPLTKPGSSNGQRNRMLLKQLVPPDRNLTKAQQREMNKKAIDNRMAFEG
ncbi:MAG: hypothetical protein NTZ84_00725 [Candidatus Nealsonbacteria bacterium]|nr:hypothetical protein [Candidatus Nealsonbacteria bacterium]